MTAQIRLATDEDLPKLATIYYEARLRFPWEAEPDLLDLFEAIEDETQFVIERQGTIVGFVSFFEPTQFIHLLFVIPRAQGQGLGQQLIAHTRQYCGGHLQLKCVIENQRAYRFYLKNNWEVLATHVTSEPHYYLMAQKT